MKTDRLTFTVALCAFAFWCHAGAQTPEPSDDVPPPPGPEEVGPPPDEVVPLPPEGMPPGRPAFEGEEPPWEADREGWPPGFLGPEMIPAPTTPEAAPAPIQDRAGPALPTRSDGSATEAMRFVPPADNELGEDERGLRLNFKSAPLEMVLNYLSDAAGFVIVPEVDVRGRVDVWSNQPLTKSEALEVLNSSLAKNGYAALQNGRMLFIISKDEAKTRNIPVKAGADPEGIPRSEEIVTQIIPVKYIDATQLIRDLQPLLPTTATLTANEGGNSLVITDTQINIRRMAEIVQALDTALASISTVRVFTLQYADAKALATVVKELFASQQTNARGNDRARMFFRGRDGRGGGEEGGGGAGGGRAPAVPVVAVADERANALVVSAPAEQIPIIEDLVAQVDIIVDDVTEVRVFHLKHADAQETADLLTSLFPDSTGRGDENRRSRFQFGGPFGDRGRGNRGAAGTEQSDRMLKETRVVAVPDLRTHSVIVSASRDLMPQIAEMIADLDANPAQKQKVFVFSLENTDPQAVQDVLESLFPQNTGRNGAMNNRRNTNTRQTGTQLNTRATQMQNQGTGRGSGIGGNSAFGSGFGNTTGR